MVGSSLYLPLVLAVLALQEGSQVDISKHARVIYEQSTASSPAFWRVQTSIRTLAQSGKGRTVTLISMQHIARAEYYSTIHAQLKECDAVLCEGWKELPGADIHADLDWIARFRKASARILDLSQQVKFEAETGIELVRIDIGIARMKEVLSKVESIVPKDQKDFVLQLEAFDEKAAGAQELDTTRSNLMRSWMMEVRNHALISSTSPLAALNLERDKVIPAGIKEFMNTKPAKRIALMYGAAHTPSIERMLTDELGYKLAAATWVDSLDILEKKVVPQGKKPDGK